MSRYFIYKEEICPFCNGEGIIPIEKRKEYKPFSPITPTCPNCFGEQFIQVKVDLTKEILEEILGNE